MKLITLLLSGLLGLLPLVSHTQTGCPDPQAINYDPEATLNDGSCRYENPGLNPVKVSKLEERLKECSGLVKVGDDYWALNDSGNSDLLYKVDVEKGEILHEVFIKNLVNTDWEDLAVDESFIYVGDFGNNKGNRRDLSIGKIPRAHLEKDTAIAEKIYFSYADQNSYDLEETNHDFDMEAMVCKGDSLYLFSKNWVNGKTRVYALGKSPGKFILHPKDSMDLMGQLTAADLSPDKETLALLGYTRKGKVWLFIVDQFQGSDFFSGNKRRFDLGNALRLGQAEAICFKNDTAIWIGSEKFSFVRQQIHSLSLPGKEPPPMHQFPFPDGFSLKKDLTSSNKWELSLGRPLPVKIIEVRDLEGNLIQQLKFESARSGIPFSGPTDSNDFLLRVSIGQNIYIKRVKKK